MRAAAAGASGGGETRKSAAGGSRARAAQARWACCVSALWPTVRRACGPPQGTPTALHGAGPKTVLASSLVSTGRSVVFVSGVSANSSVTPMKVAGARGDVQVADSFLGANLPNREMQSREIPISRD